MKHYSQKLSLRFRLGAAVVAFLFLAICQQNAEAQTNTFPASGNVGVGTTTPDSQLHVVSESTAVTRGILNSQHSADGNSVLFTFRKSRGTRVAPSAASNGDNIGNLYAEGYDGSAYVSGGRIRFAIDGPVASGSMPTAVQFFSGTSGSGIERMRISSSGNVGIGTATPGFRFDVQGGQINSSGGLCIAGDCKTAWSQVGGGSSQWTTSGSNIYYNTGSVGVGTTTPSAALQINSITPGLAAVKVKGATSQTANLLEFRTSDDTLRSYVNPSGALFFNPAMDQVPSALTIAPNFNGAYYASAEHNAFTINGANMANYGLYTGPTVRMFLIKDVNGYNAFEVNKIGMATLRGDMSNRPWVTNIHVDSSNAYYAGTADGLLINGTGLANHGLYSGGTVRMLRVVGTGEALAVTRDNRTGFGTLTPVARVEIMGTGSTSASVGLSVKNSAASSLLHVRDDGYVGIGTAGPGFKFDVQGGQINASGGLCIAGDCKTAWSQVGGGGSSQWTTTGSNIYFNTGNVGIGTDSPLTKLHVAGGTRVDGANGKVYLGTSAVAGSRGLEFIEENATTFAIRHHDPSVAWRNIVINPHGGSVGIGLISPLYSFDVNGGVNGFRAKAATVSSGDTIAAFENSSGVQAIVRGNGNVGIGTTAPTAKLEVLGNINVTGTGPNAGNINISGTINAKYQDVAEWVESSQALDAGTVVVLDHTRSNQVVASSKAYDTRVAGVISVQPGIALGESGATKVLVATTGRVKIKVDASAGPIEIGDLLVTSDKEGVAKKSEPISLGGVQIHRPGTLIGKALEPLAKGSGEILVLLSLQ